MEKIGTEELANLIGRAASGDDGAFSELCRIYEALVKKSVASFSARIDMPPEDIKQEALLALSRAAAKYDLENTKVTFGLFAKICIKNALISLERKSATQKRRREKSRDSVEALGENDGWTQSFVSSERIEKLLTPFENKVLQMFVEGLSYDEIASEMNVGKKKVDNTLYRLRKKLKKSELL